ncbi:hypothetical protein L2750_13125 [Shewanella submarina]|uniref:Uncharacterized protein n=1 Tax=Shewanella submarina TaxID=2016376 RepID=A0ABV7GKU0_9GAMM|nr:hypothetical protein [Shewanella submarina]MCL1038092.1 hypothetical protein [Shewanella submarina]
MKPSTPSPTRYIFLFVAMTVVIWLLLTDTRKDSRETLLVEYQQLFQASYDAVVLEAKIKDRNLGQATVEIDGMKVNLLNGYPTPRSMLSLLGLPDCSIEQSDVAVCITELNDQLELSVSGKGTDTRIILYPAGMAPAQWWQTCMLIYYRPQSPTHSESGKAPHYQSQLYIDKC